ncbi:MAG: CDGSH iron-sulfur domain-containing protein [Planctomycetes bacterium]|nr:CDGSH iron-sulfur domain-containing protein [Planctomycetota bacterium]
MSDVTIEIRENGPLLVSGQVTLVDKMGTRQQSPEGKNIALCRCGLSEKRPFCDGTHKRSGFTSTEVLPEPAKE